VAERKLTLRDLNRAALARQLLLARQRRPISETVEQLVGLQAQVPAAPFVGLWTRLEGFRRDELQALIQRRQVVRVTMMRATLHLMTVGDFWLLRPALQEGLTYQYDAILRRRSLGLDIPAAIAAGRQFFAEPHTFAEFRDLLERLEPGKDIRALAYAVRTHLPLVQVPSPTAPWGYPGNARFVTAESWLGRSLPANAPLRETILRYLAAFGPARAVDLQAWAGLPPVREALDELRPELIVLRGARGEFLDLPDAPRPAPGTPAPPRFLPEFDNLLLAWRDRTRIIADEHRSRIMASPVLMRPTFLLDGFVAGTWRLEKSQEAATLVVEPFAKLAARDGEALAREGERLARFMEPTAATIDVRLAEP